jgi:hypothetical protein
MFLSELYDAHSVFLTEVTEVHLASVDNLGKLESTIPYKKELKNFSENIA